jgi:heme oxygenase (biliverdin-producing, ferredoxin)
MVHRTRLACLSLAALGAVRLGVAESGRFWGSSASTAAFVHGPWASPSQRGRAPFGAVVLRSSPVTADQADKAKGQGGHGHGHGGMMGEVDKNSFVQTELRKEAMRLHTKDQAKEGEQEAQTPFTKWDPTRQDYLQFLVDSKLVYQTFDDIVGRTPELAPFRQTGLERVDPLAQDIQWMLATYSDVTLPEVGEYGQEYARFLTETAARSLPAFACHYYNHYFAHTAGGRMIGKKMAAMLLDGIELNFYKWDGDVKVMLDNVRKNLDVMANGWSQEQKDACVKETENTFRYGGSLLRYLARTQ